MILHKIDGNSTWIEPMKNNIEGEIILARRRELARMKHQGIVPKHQVLDNEILAAHRKEIWATYMKFQLVPSDDHRCNLAEKAIQTWKERFIGVMSGAVANFHIHLWCQAITQAERQLLLLQKPHVHPKVSAYAQVYVPHDYNAAPFVPIGILMLVHDKLKCRGNFAEHCRKGCVLVTGFEHYRAWKMWMKYTRATRISATVFNKHKDITNPSITSKDRIMVISGKLVADLKGRMATHLSKTSLHQF